MPEVLFQAIRFRRDIIFAWSLCQKHLAIDLRCGLSENTTFSHGVSVYKGVKDQ